VARRYVHLLDAQVHAGAAAAAAATLARAHDDLAARAFAPWLPLPLPKGARSGARPPKAGEAEGAGASGAPVHDPIKHMGSLLALAARLCVPSSLPSGGAEGGAEEAAAEAAPEEAADAPASDSDEPSIDPLPLACALAEHAAAEARSEALSQLAQSGLETSGLPTPLATALGA
jgi:hypothetical protein